MEQHRTHDIYQVKRLLGHRCISNTKLYIHLEKAIFNNENDGFHVRKAKTVEEATKLLEVGFEYVTEMDGIKLFRKWKQN